MRVSTPTFKPRNFLLRECKQETIRTLSDPLYSDLESLTIDCDQPGVSFDAALNFKFPPNLKYLRIYGCLRFDLATIPARLLELDLTAHKNSTAATLFASPAAPQLETLNVRGFVVSAPGLPPSLKVVHLSLCDLGPQFKFRGLTKLEDLELTCVTSRESVTVPCPSRQICIRSCPNLQMQPIMELNCDSLQFAIFVKAPISEIAQPLPSKLAGLYISDCPKLRTVFDANQFPALMLDYDNNVTPTVKGSQLINGLPVSTEMVPIKEKRGGARESIYLMSETIPSYVLQQEEERALKKMVDALTGAESETL